MNSSLIKGTAYLTISNFIFLASGYLVQILIGRSFDPVLYGTFGIVIYLLNLFITILATGFSQGISRSIAEKPGAAKNIFSKSLKIELIITGSFAALYFILAPQIAQMFADPSMSHYLRLSALLIPLYGVRTVFTGLLIGTKRFDKQALSLIAAAVVKLVLVAVFLSTGMQLGGVLLAYFFAALASLLVSVAFSKIREGGNDYFSGKQLLKISVPISLYAFGFPFLMSIDLFLVKRLIADGSFAGYYNSAVTLARFLYIALVGLNYSLLPTIASSFAQKNIKQVQYYIRNSLRFSIMFLLPLSIIASLTAKSLIPLIFSEKYILAANPLSILVFGIFLLTITRLLLTVLVAIGKQNISFYVTMSLIIISVVLNFLLIPNWQMTGAAWATTISGISGLIFVLLYTMIKIKKVVNIPSLIKIVSASALTAVLTWWLFQNYSFQGFSIILWYGLILGFYIIILFIFREITRNDYKRLKEALFKKVKLSKGLNQ